MNNKLLLMLESETIRYEFYLVGIARSNVDRTLVRYELCYNRIESMALGSSVTRGARLHQNFDEFVNMLVAKGFREVTIHTKKFA